jgi:hypothetical protein
MNETVLDDCESRINAEITLYDDGEIEIVLSDTKYDRCANTYYCNVNDLENGIKNARAKLGV